MSHHFIDQLEDLKARLARMTALVQLSVEQAVEAIFDANAALAQRVIDGDATIDAEEVQVEKSAIDMLALYQPAAGDLRLITTVIKANSDFERIADCAVNIAQRVLPITHAHDGSFKLHRPARDGQQRRRHAARHDQGLQPWR